MDRIRTFTVSPKQDGKRLDNVCRELLKDVSLGRIAKLIRKRKIQVNQKKTRHQQRVKAGDTISFREAPMEEAWTKRGRDRVMSPKVAMVESIDFTILFEDEHLIAVSKPAGLLVHGTLKEPNASTLIDQVMAYIAYEQMEESDDEEGDDRSLSEFVRPSPKFQPSLAHRIDRQTSGVVLIAKTIECLQELTRMIKKRQLEKFYIGLVKGGLAGGVGEINAPIARRRAEGRSMDRQAVSTGKSSDNKGEGKPARTRYRTLGIHGSFSLVEFELITGRTHQIRAHMRHVGSGIAGDDEYGDRALNTFAKQNFGLKRQFLHAATIRLNHPITGDALEITAPLPEDLHQPMLAAGFKDADLPEQLQQAFETDLKTVGPKDIGVMDGDE